ncbi:high affinity immunoglobulin epsilon receptor subunit alpha isoform X1 [Sus scrofa]|uniref:Fc epsilon receptor Ia n=2 Tax=Sus scrofa TaxID=9823 RepID=A0A8D0W7P9_PIG|nr:high affinity immunoglobulin epsilon receptor subunit alpha isoform X1 [Sus scrofa]
MSTPIGVPALLWIALLLFSPDGMAAVIQESQVSLNPPWNRIFRGENVTLTCIGNYSLENYPTNWTHNNKTLEVKTSSWDLKNAKPGDSGKYRCQSKDFTMSEPVHLEVISDWLLLQTSVPVVREGQSFLLRCHGWKNLNVYKVIYYKDGKALKYWYENHNLSITNAKREDSGSYWCTGIIQKIPKNSTTLTITIQTDSPSVPSNYYWLQLHIPLLVAILFVVDTGLLISTQQQFRFLLKIKKTRRGKKFTDPQPSSDPRTD